MGSRRARRISVAPASTNLVRHTEICIGHFERHSNLRAGRVTDFERVDHLLLCGVAELQRRPTYVEDDDACIVVALKRGLLGQTESVSIEGQRLVEILGLDDEAELHDARGR